MGTRITSDKNHRTGYDIAGFKPSETAPLFRNGTDVPNIYLPQRFWDVLNAK